jgi:phage regulator Rha-like protein
MVNDLTKIEHIENRIYTIRGQRVMLDFDIAELYEVETRNFNKAVKRNIEKFPSDFMFQLTQSEFSDLMFQIGTSSWGGRRKLPYAFTEHGVLMTANILNSEKANIVSVQIVKAFIKLRDYALSNVAVNEQIAELRQLLMLHIESNDHKFSKQDKAIRQIILALNNLIEQPREPKKIGFSSD